MVEGPGMLAELPNWAGTCEYMTLIQPTSAAADDFFIIGGFERIIGQTCENQRKEL